MKLKLPQPSEHQIQQLLINYMKLKGYYVTRMNSGQYSVGEGRSKRYIMGHEKGTPDVMAFKEHCIHHAESHIKIYFIEVKRPGKKPTCLQEQKMKELAGYGAKCIIATSIEDLEAAGI